MGYGISTKILCSWSFNLALMVKSQDNSEESGCSVVDYSTLYIRVAGSSVTGGSVVSLSETLYPLVSTGSSQEGPSRLD